MIRIPDEARYGGDGERRLARFVSTKRPPLRMDALSLVFGGNLRGKVPQRGRNVNAFNSLYVPVYICFRP